MERVRGEAIDRGEANQKEEKSSLGGGKKNAG